MNYILCNPGLQKNIANHSQFDYGWQFVLKHLEHCPDGETQKEGLPISHISSLNSTWIGVNNDFGQFKRKRKIDSCQLIWISAQLKTQHAKTNNHLCGNVQKKKKGSGDTNSQGL